MNGRWSRKERFESKLKIARQKLLMAVQIIDEIMEAIIEKEQNTKSLCTKCPVKSTCGIYTGLRIVHDREGNTVECNRYDFYTKEKE